MIHRKRVVVAVAADSCLPHLSVLRRAPCPPSCRRQRQLFVELERRRKAEAADLKLAKKLSRKGESQGERTNGVTAGGDDDDNPSRSPVEHASNAACAVTHCCSSCSVVVVVGGRGGGGGLYASFECCM